MNGIRDRRGFTLIELMVVVVIIGILAALAIPRFNLASHKSREKEADTILKQVYTLQSAYYAHNSTYASTEAELLTVGFTPPPRLEYYDQITDYSLPLCMSSKGGWASRAIDANGTITDGGC